MTFKIALNGQIIKVKRNVQSYNQLTKVLNRRFNGELPEHFIIVYKNKDGEFQKVKNEKHFEVLTQDYENLNGVKLLVKTRNKNRNSKRRRFRNMIQQMKSQTTPEQRAKRKESWKEKWNEMTPEQKALKRQRFKNLKQRWADLPHEQRMKKKMKMMKLRFFRNLSQDSPRQRKPFRKMKQKWVKLRHEERALKKLYLMQMNQEFNHKVFQKQRKSWKMANKQGWRNLSPNKLAQKKMFFNFINQECFPQQCQIRKRNFQNHSHKRMLTPELIIGNKMAQMNHFNRRKGWKKNLTEEQLAQKKAYFGQLKQMCSPEEFRLKKKAFKKCCKKGWNNSKLNPELIKAKRSFFKTLRQNLSPEEFILAKKAWKRNHRQRRFRNLSPHSKFTRRLQRQPVKQFNLSYDLLSTNESSDTSQERKGRRQRHGKSNLKKRLMKFKNWIQNSMRQKKDTHRQKRRCHYKKMRNSHNQFNDFRVI